VERGELPPPVIPPNFSKRCGCTPADCSVHPMREPTGAAFQDYTQIRAFRPEPGMPPRRCYPGELLLQPAYHSGSCAGDRICHLIATLVSRDGWAQKTRTLSSCYTQLRRESDGQDPCLVAAAEAMCCCACLAGCFVCHRRHLLLLLTSRPLYLFGESLWDHAPTSAAPSQQVMLTAFFIHPADDSDLGRLLRSRAAAFVQVLSLLKPPAPLIAILRGDATRCRLEALAPAGPLVCAAADAISVSAFAAN